MTPAAPKRTTLSPGQKVFDDNGQQLFGLPEKADESPLAKLVNEMRNLPPGSPLQKVYMDAIAKASTQQPATSVQVNTDNLGLKP